MIESPLLVCMLPARNAAHDLPGWFASVERFCDAVVALDDGSTDETAELLAAHPLVKRLLRNPRRESYAGWNDAANRNRLLDVVAELNPTWLLSLDADERIDEEDGRALREFLQTDALPGVAYGLAAYSVQGDGSWYIDYPLWTYRLFAFEPGQHFQNRKLHFAPIPDAIPRGAYIATSFRIQHLGTGNQQRRHERFEKYREVDPNNRYWPDYTDILRADDQSEWLKWPIRQPDTPALLGLEPSLRHSGEQVDVRTISVVVLASEGEEVTRRAVQSAQSQTVSIPVEVLVVGTAPVGDSTVRWVQVPPGSRPGFRRNAGLRSASGDVVLFQPAELELAPGAIEAAVEAHRLGFAVVTGTVDVSTSDPRLRALAYETYGGPSNAEESGLVDSPGCFSSYRTSLLREFGPFPEDLPGGEEIPVNRRLELEDFVTYREPAFRADFQPFEAPGAVELFRAGWRRGDALGRFYSASFRERGELMKNLSPRERWVLGLGPGGEAARVATRRNSTESGRGGVPERLLKAGTRAGFASHLARPQHGKSVLLWGKPVVLALLVLCKGRRLESLAIVKLDCVTGTARVVRLPAHLCLEPGEGSHSIVDALGWNDPGGVTKFNVRATIGAPLDLDLEDFVVIDVEAAHVSMAEITEPRRFAGPLGGLRLLAVLQRNGAVRSSIERNVLAVTAMLARNVIRDGQGIDLSLAPSGALHEDQLASLKRFLNEERGGAILDERDRYKRIRWV